MIQCLMRDEYLIGIDVGTTSVKAGLFTTEGAPVENVALPDKYGVRVTIHSSLVREFSL